jgi:hypothetical protein
MPRLSPTLPAWKLKFERKGLHLHITLVDAKKQAAERAKEAAAEKVLALHELEDQRGGQMQTQLRELLRRHPEARVVLKHLAVLESLLRKNGERAFVEPPVDLLRAALRQLEALVKDWSPKGLAELRSRLSVAIAEREVHDVREAPQRSDFLDEQRLEVSEASPSDFRQAQTHWDLAGAADTAEPPAMAAVRPR